jgi:hypothetical protein
VPPLRAKNDGNHSSTHALYISAFLNNNVLSHEILWIHTTVGTLHKGTFKIIFQRVKEYRGIS